MADMLDRHADECERCGYRTSIWRMERESPLLCQLCHKVPSEPVSAMCYLSNLILDEFAKAKKEIDTIYRKVKQLNRAAALESVPGLGLEGASWAFRTARCLLAYLGFTSSTGS